MFDPKQTSIILVPGQWHTEFHIQPCLAPLKAAGYKVIPSPLLCVGIQETRSTFADEVANISSAIASEVNQGQEVCVAAHSAGGLPACEAVNKYLSTNADKKHLIRLVLVASFLDRARTRNTGFVKGWLKVDLETGTSIALNAEEVFYNDMPLDRSRPFVEALKTAMLWQDSVGASSDEWKTVRKAFVLCLQDNAIAPDIQRLEIEENGFEGFEMDAGHCPFVSMPEKFVTVLDQILRQQTLN